MSALKGKRFGDEAAKGKWLALEKSIGIITTLGLKQRIGPKRKRALKFMADLQEGMMASYGAKAAPWIMPDDPAYWGKLHGRIRDRGGAADLTLRQLMGETLKRGQATRTTRYTDPFWHDRLENLALTMLRIIEADYPKGHPLKRQHPGPGEILFGTAPGFDVNGRAVGIADSQYYVVLVDETLFAFSLAWGQVRAAAMVPKGAGTFNLDQDRRRQYMSENPGIGEAAVALFRAGAIDGDLRNFSGIPWDDSRSEAVRVIVTAVELFVVAHELAHCFQGRGEAFKPLPGTEELPGTEKLPDTEENEKKTKAWQREFWADYFGLQLAVEAGRKQGWQPAILIAGAMAFFRGLDLLEASVAVLRKSNRDLLKGTETHPSNAQRLAFIRAHLNPILQDEKDTEIAEILIRQDDLLTSDITDAVTTGIRTDAAAGKCASPVWPI
jgi:hypothetical protein